MKTLTLALLFTSTAAFAQAERHHHHRPPEVAFAACAGAQDGAACTVKLPEHEVTGSCVKVPERFKEDAGKLVCMPPRPPHEPAP